ncbi:MAG: M14 family metallopeptidase [Gemmatimonadota bacterium]
MSLRYLLVAFLAIPLMAPASILPAQTTRPERTDFRETSSHADVVAFLDSLQHAGAGIRIGSMGRSPRGKSIPYVIASRPLVDGPGDAHRTGKPILYIQGNIHSGEVEGKEAAQMLLRDLTLGPLRSLLDSVVVILVPIYNADGNDDFGPGERNRAGQNGPPLVGKSTNGQGLNLNRDYVKLEAPETRASLALIDAWEPDVFIDLHTTDGSYHGYALTYAPGLNPNSPPANEYVRNHFLPLIRERMRRRHHQEVFDYGNFRNQEPDSLVQGWETYDARPRFGTNSMGMRGRLAILSEGYSNAPFRERIDATYNFLREILSLAAEERTTITALVASSARFAPDSVTVRSVLAPPTRQDVIAEVTQADSDGHGPFARRKRTGVYRTIRMPVWDRFAPARREALPSGYLLPPEFSGIAAMLVRQGIIVQRLRENWHGDAEAFSIDSLWAAPAVFEGHRTVMLNGRWSPRSAELHAGWFYIPTAQRQGVFAAYLLEPASEDGFVTWNLLDRAIAVGDEYPFLRVRAPLKADAELVTDIRAESSDEFTPR